MTSDHHPPAGAAGVSRPALGVGLMLAAMALIPFVDGLWSAYRSGTRLALDGDPAS